MAGRSGVPAEETAAGIGTVFVDGAFPGGEKFTAVLDDQFMATCQGKIEAAGAKSPEPLKFGPGQLDAGKRAAAGAVAFFAATVVIDRTVHEHAMLDYFRAVEERHFHASLQPALRWGPAFPLRPRRSGQLHCSPDSLNATRYAPQTQAPSVSRFCICANLCLEPLHGRKLRSGNYLYLHNIAK